MYPRQKVIKVKMCPRQKVIKVSFWNICYSFHVTVTIKSSVNKTKSDHVAC